MSKIAAAKLKGMMIKTKYSALPSDFASWRMGLEFTENNPAKVLITSGAVETVYDQSGYSRDFTNATSANRPSFTAGLGASFDGVNDLLQCVTSPIVDAVGTLVYIARWNRLGSVDTVFSCGDSGVSDGNAWTFQKDALNRKITKLGISAFPGQTGSFVFSNTTDFYVNVHQSNNMYTNTNQADIIIRGGGSRWFDDIPGTADFMRIGRLAGSTASGELGMFTLKGLHYFNVNLSNQESVRLVNGLKAYYGI